MALSKQAGKSQPMRAVAAQLVAVLKDMPMPREATGYISDVSVQTTGPQLRAKDMTKRKHEATARQSVAWRTLSSSTVVLRPDNKAREAAIVTDPATRRLTRPYLSMSINVA